MPKRRKVLSPAHARALIKEAIGIVEGNRAIEAEGVAESAAIEAAHTLPNLKSKSKHSTRT